MATLASALADVTAIASRLERVLCGHCGVWWYFDTISGIAPLRCPRCVSDADAEELETANDGWAHAESAMNEALQDTADIREGVVAIRQKLEEIQSYKASKKLAAALADIDKHLERIEG